nr:DUF2642 domain-containing protein [Cohnella zeiphila]
MWMRINKKEFREYIESLRLLLLTADRSKEGGAPGSEGQASCRSGGSSREDDRGRSCCEDVPPALRCALERSLHRNVVIYTAGGTVSGIVQEVGRDYAVVREAGDLHVIVNLDKVIYAEVGRDE